MSDSIRLLVLGGSSWLGWLLLRRLQDGVQSVWECSYTYRNTPPPLRRCRRAMRVATASDVLAVVDQAKSDVVVNFLRGETATDLRMHLALVSRVKETGAFYVYASSALALEGYAPGTELTEDLPACATSDYGKFKAECERHIVSAGIQALILRFASVHGWAPHRLTRTEGFLGKLRSAQKVKVDTGVMQNRWPAELLVEASVELLNRRTSGIIHLGATDASEETQFLRRMASQFGYPPHMVEDGDPRNLNLNVKPNRLHEICGTRFKTSEEETLGVLLRCDFLTQYRNSQEHILKE